MNKLQVKANGDYIHCRQGNHRTKFFIDPSKGTGPYYSKIKNWAEGDAGFMSAGDLIAIGNELNKVAAKWMKVNKHSVVLKHGGYDYVIDLANIKTPLDLIDWVIHLSEKNWMCAETIGDFAKEVCRAKGWVINVS